MPHITDSIRPELTRLLPASVLIEVTCFVFYDHHPRDQKQIDVIVGTSNGEIKEYFRRGLVNSMNLKGRYQPTDVKIVRNGNCDLFYLVIAGDELTIVSRKEKPEIHRRVHNVERYGVEDAVCRGQGGLKVVIKDDAVPLVFNDNFEDLGDKASVLNALNADDSLPILTELMRKLTQAKYSVKCNENTLKEFLSLRQVAALASYQKIHPNTEDSVFNGNSTKVDEVLRVKSLTPWVKMCNKKIVIELIISYTNSIVPIEDIHILLHGTDRKTMVYVTKLYERIKASPGWREKKTHSLISDNDVAIVTVVDIDEISKNYLNKMEFDGVIAYKRERRDHVIPFEHVVLTSVDTMAEEFNALAGNNLDEMLSLAIVATTIRTELLLRHVKKQDEPSLMIPETFATHLQMEKIANTDRTIIYKKSPYHIVNGSMLVFGDDCVANDCYRVFAYTISPTQLVVLLHYIHDAMPHTIVITTPNVKISPKSAKPSKREEETLKSAPKIYYDDYASSLMNQTDMLLEYLDECMTKMEVSKDMEIKSKIGSEIDFFAGGLPAYLEFRKKMLDEACKGAKSLKIDDSDLTTNAASDVQMVMD